MAVTRCSRAAREEEGDDRSRVRERRGSHPPAGSSAPSHTTAVATAAAACHREQLDQRNASGRRCEKSTRAASTTGMTSNADLGARGDRDLAREPHLPAVRDDDRAAVLGRVADDCHDHDRDEELAQADSSCERIERVDEDLARPSAVAAVATASATSAVVIGHVPRARRRCSHVRSARWRRKFRPTTAR